MNHKPLDRQLDRVAALSDPVRRDLYFLISGRSGEVSRDEAAGALGISRALAAFHLDKLVDAGLLVTSFRRLTSRSGPGAGRPSKLYRRSEHQVELSLPVRRYELAGRLMTKALAEGRSNQALERLATAAREEGQRLGFEARSNGSSASSSRSLKLAMVVLRDNGFEPQVEGSSVVLRNCPFEALARENKELVCGMNLALVEGVVHGLGNPDVRAKLAPAPGRCCVTLLSEDRQKSG